MTWEISSQWIGTAVWMNKHFTIWMTMRGRMGSHRIGLPWHGGWRQRLTYGVLGASWHFLSWNRKRKLYHNDNKLCMFPQRKTDSRTSWMYTEQINLTDTTVFVFSPGLSIDCVRFKGPLLKLLSLLWNKRRMSSCALINKVKVT